MTPNRNFGGVGSGEYSIQEFCQGRLCYRTVLTFSDLRLLIVTFSVLAEKSITFSIYI